MTYPIFENLETGERLYFTIWKKWIQMMKF